MSTRLQCGRVYVELGETPERDRLVRCTRWPCLGHDREHDWVAEREQRLDAYREQERRLALQAAGVSHEQAALL